MKAVQDKKSNETPLALALQSIRGIVSYIFVCGFFVNILLLSTSVYSMQVLDRVLSSGNTNTLLMLTLVVILALALLSLLQGARSFGMSLFGIWFENKLSEGVFRNSIKTSLVAKSKAGSQQLRDLQTIKTYVTSPALVSIFDTPWAIIFIIVLFMLHLYIGIIAIIGIVVTVFFAIITNKSTKPLLEKNNENFIKSMRNAEQAIRNAEVVESMGMFKNVLISWQKFNSLVQDTQNIVSQRQSILSEVNKFFRLVVQISVTGVGAWLAINHEISTGAIIASSSIMGRALSPFEVFINSIKSFLDCRKAYLRLNESYMRMPDDDNRMSLPEPSGSIVLEGVYFAPPMSQKYIIKGISFSIKAGEAVAVIGASGSGKTSLAKLIVGAWRPSVGAIRIDGANIHDWNRDELGRHVGYLPQDIELFSGSVKVNIARMDENPDPEEVLRAAQLAGVHEMVLRLPNAYDTEIGPDGSVLSGGQRQRIALARAFYGKPNIILLDEPNSSLDSEGEAALSAAIDFAKTSGVTIVVISHRAPVLSVVDKIAVVSDGALAAFGPAREVMNKMQNTLLN
ncbi:putative AprD family type I secretion system permease/ATPase [Candidatus Cyrtobacter comes]|uniref:AprD family type I secretion system permease/ATPase n=1 Tax=Candidatus Cyrtobacter comes TaxID=675776 RepID=A0ABU5L7F7_9RICK|nr:type I secretion system permease/ATPase [Candidatus Cyrtobacter comes]MDZ5762059.1 putative AprD family type I secretion system permease/ATPase [Candidatus Cyrtobacter comes]